MQGIELLLQIPSEGCEDFAETRVLQLPAPAPAASSVTVNLGGEPGDRPAGFLSGSTEEFHLRARPLSDVIGLQVWHKGSSKSHNCHITKVRSSGVEWSGVEVE